MKYEKFMLTGFQVRAARRGLGLSIKELSKSTSISETTLKRLEKTKLLEPLNSGDSVISKLLSFYSTCGIKFSDGNKIEIEMPHLKEF